MHTHIQLIRNQLLNPGFVQQNQLLNSLLNRYKSALIRLKYVPYTKTTAVRTLSIRYCVLA
jgi:hypothetical protein